MTTLRTTPFHYNYVPGVAQYSSGVVAHDGYEIVRVRLFGTPNLEAATSLIEKYLDRLGLAPSSVCAFELRSPGQFDFESFTAFNKAYIGLLDRWGVMLGADENPVARSNVIPTAGKVDAPSVHSFSFVRPVTGKSTGGSTFIVSGSAEVPEGKGGSYTDHTIALDDTSPEGIREKAVWVREELTRRMGVIGSAWEDLTDVQVYTVWEYREVHEEISASVPASTNVTWHYCTPPVVKLEFEMDCRRVLTEDVIFVD